jgi:hypothetical protein
MVQDHRHVSDQESVLFSSRLLGLAEEKVWSLSFVLQGDGNLVGLAH